MDLALPTDGHHNSGKHLLRLGRNTFLGPAGQFANVRIWVLQRFFDKHQPIQMRNLADGGNRGLTQITDVVVETATECRYLCGSRAYVAGGKKSYHFLLIGILGLI